MAVSGEWFDGFDFNGDGIGDEEQDGPGWVVVDPVADANGVREGVNYVAAWREGQRAAARLYAYCAAAGVTTGVEFTPYQLPEGRVVMGVRMRPVDADRIARYWADRFLDELLEAQRERQEAAPKCRGPDDRAA